MPEESANTADLFEIIRTTRSMRRLKPDPVPNELIRKILEAGVDHLIVALDARFPRPESRW